MNEPKLLNVYRIDSSGNKIHGQISEKSFKMFPGDWQIQRELTEDEKKPINVKAALEYLKSQGVDTSKIERVASVEKVVVKDNPISAEVTAPAAKVIDPLEEVNNQGAKPEAKVASKKATQRKAAPRKPKAK